VSAQVTLGNSNSLSRAKGDVLENPAVFAHRDFILGAAIEIVEDYSGETALRQAAKVMDIDHAGRS
jgi:hypothetical protein